MPMTLQEVLDRNYQWFIVDKNPPGFDVSKYLCIYDGPPIDGKPCRCAIGCCLTDDLLKIAQSCKGSIAVLMAKSQLIRDFFGNENKEALSRLQGLHDYFARNNLSHKQYKDALLQWGSDNDLILPE